MKKTTNANKKEIGQKPGKFTDEEKRLLKIKGPKYILGLKVGSAVLGWAAIEVDANEDTKGVLRLGVRHFEPGVSGNVSRGQDESNALARREARGARKNQARRTQRQKQLFRLLQEKELLPLHDGEAANYSVERDRILTKLDGVLRETISSEEQGKHLYCLRRRALDEDLMPYELGRILYHLSQRRGYKSNRKEKGGGKKKEEEWGRGAGRDT